MKNIKDLVTVVIPVYNREDTIKRSINSVLQQTYSAIEIIVVDDCSDDSTVLMIEEINDSRIHVLKLDCRSGANKARNAGIQAAKGTYIAFQDSDDEWLPDKLEKQISYLKENNCMACFCAHKIIDGELQSFVPRDYQNKQKYESLIVEILRNNNVIGTPTLVVHKDVFDSIGMFDEDMPRLQDYEYVIRIADKFQIGYINESLVNVYRLRVSTTTNSSLLFSAFSLLLEKHNKFLNCESIIQLYFKNSKTWINESIALKECEKFTQLLHKCNIFNVNPADILAQLNMKKSFLVEKLFFQQLNKLTDKKFIIYGAGIVANDIYVSLKSVNISPAAFLITHNKNVESLYQIPVYSIDEWNKKDFPVILGVALESQNEILDLLDEYGFQKIILYPY